MTRSTAVSLTVVAALAAGTIALVSCAEKSEITTGTPTAPSAAALSLQDRIARSWIAASPVPDVSDAHARDAAAVKLAQCQEFINAAGESMLWGGFDEKKGYDPEVHNLNWFSPIVWSKLYLSTFMFTGGYRVHEEGKYTVLEVDAKFRDSLDAGDYPYPFWHSPKKWQAYVDAGALVVVFEGPKVSAVYRKGGVHDPAKPLANKMWDGKWTWTDEQGNTQPRASLYTYSLSSDNPHRSTLDTAYRNLEQKFRSQNCMECHAPDNTAKATKLQMLNYPNQALAGRHTIVQMLREDKMPPMDKDTGKPAGLHNDTVREELIKLALVFEKEADAALKYESSRKDEQSGTAR